MVSVFLLTGVTVLATLVRQNVARGCYNRASIHRHEVIVPGVWPRDGPWIGVDIVPFLPNKIPD